MAAGVSDRLWTLEELVESTSKQENARSQVIHLGHLRYHPLRLQQRGHWHYRQERFGDL
jgi:hypothetical protein